MEVTIDQFASLADVFGGILETYLEAYRIEHPDAKYVRVEPENKMLSRLIKCLLRGKPIPNKSKIRVDNNGTLDNNGMIDNKLTMENIMRYSSSIVLFPDTTFSQSDFDRACQLGHLKYAKWLFSIDVVYDVDKALHLAIAYDHANVVKWITQDILKVDRIKITDLYGSDSVNTLVALDLEDEINISAACIAGAAKIFKLAYERGMRYPPESFIFACRSGSLELVKYILSIDTKAQDYDEAVCNACRSGNLQLVKYLLSIATNIDINAIGNNALCNACSSGNIELVEYLLSICPSASIYGGLCTAIYRGRLPPFSCACARGDLKLVKYLVDRHTPPSEVFIDDLIVSSIHNRYIELAEYLLKTFDSKDPNLLFTKVCAEGTVSIVAGLLQKYPSIDIHYNYDDAFFSATGNKNKDVTDYLLTLDTADSYGRTIYEKALASIDYQPLDIGGVVLDSDEPSTPPWVKCNQPSYHDDNLDKYLAMLQKEISETAREFGINDDQDDHTDDHTDDHNDHDHNDHDHNDHYHNDHDDNHSDDNTDQDDSKDTQ